MVSIQGESLSVTVCVCQSATEWVSGLLNINIRMSSYAIKTQREEISGWSISLSMNLSKRFKFSAPFHPLHSCYCESYEYSALSYCRF